MNSMVPTSSTKLPSSTPITQEVGYYVAPKIAMQLLRAREIVRKGNQDRVFIIDGREGTGKSTLAMQLAYLVDRTFNIDRVAYTAKEFETVVRKAKKFQAVVFDEAFNGLSSKSVMSNENKRLVKMLMECRQRNLFLFITLPTIFMLEKYAAIFRSQALFHVYAKRGKDKDRRFKIYNYHNKRYLYMVGKKLMDYNKPKITFNMKFFGKLPPTIDEKEYRKKKHEAFKYDKNPEDEVSKKELQRNKLLELLHNRYKMPLRAIERELESDGLGWRNSTMSTTLSKMRETLDASRSTV